MGKLVPLSIFAGGGRPSYGVGVELRQLKIYELHDAGYSNKDIGVHLGLQSTSVSRILKDFVDTWRESLHIDRSVALAKEVLRLDMVEDELWSLYYEPVDNTRTEKLKLKSDRAEHRRERYNQAVDNETRKVKTGVLSQIARTVIERAKLTGNYAYVSPSSGGGKVSPTVIFNISGNAPAGLVSQDAVEVFSPCGGDTDADVASCDNPVEPAKDEVNDGQD